jgi:hypothetical protein
MEYTSIWQFMRYNPAGKLFCATGLAIGITVAYALTLPKENYAPKQTIQRTAECDAQQNKICLSELSDILK